MLRQATMADLIATAYGLDPENVQGGPSWLETDRFDLTAKIPPSTPADAAKLMLRSLLAERFKLVVHNGVAPMPAYVLTVGRDKVKMKESEGSDAAGCQYQPPPPNQPPGTISPIVFSCHSISMETFAQSLHDWAGGYLTQPVFDSTGLKGTWDFDIKWTARGQLGRAGADGISIFDAVDKELGLKLELKTEPRPVLIVDSVNQAPTPNPPGLEKILPPPPPPEFEVATIKPSKEDGRENGRFNGVEMDLQYEPLRFLVYYAWDLNENDDELVVGAPKWLGTDRFDIVAKVSTDAMGNTVQGRPRIDEEDFRQMLRALLADRFKMQSHMEDRTITAYTLIAANPKLRKADPASRTRCIEGPGTDGKDPRIANPVLNRLVSCQNMTMAQIGEKLQNLASGYIYTPVLDATGMTGSFDFTLSFSSADLARGSGGGGGGGGSAAPAAGGAASASDPNGAVSFFDAVNRQLGLKLEKQRRPAPVLVIDHIEEKPTEN
jgi:uncharacterized protein (TIGR03435 family)